MTLFDPNPNLENETLSPFCHCQSRQKREKVRACTPKCLPSPKRFVQAGVTARRRGNLIEKGEIASFHSQ